jgi:hypothetical protein
MFALGLGAAMALAAPAPVATLVPAGAYSAAGGHVVYVGPEHTLPDKRYDQYYDDSTRRIGDASALGTLRPISLLLEHRLLLTVDGAKLGASLWYATPRANPAIVLIHGNDDETREMGFLIPYFVLHGMTVIAYDQRGTGESEGNWRSEGPPQRARDVVALLAVAKRDSHVDARRVGLWAFSNGGWNRTDRCGVSADRLHDPQERTGGNAAEQHTLRGRPAHGRARIQQRRHGCGAASRS